jgi:transcription elongation factor Elf1
MKDKICPKCRGNGFVQCAIEEGRVPIVANCNLCNSQGEVHDKEFDDYFDSYVEFKSLQ